MFNFNWISKYRNELFGIAMLSIMFHHFCENYWQAVTAAVIPAAHVGAKGAFFLGYHTYVGSIGVEIFLFLSGMGLYYSYHKNPDLKRFYKRRMHRILVPYFLIAIPFWCIKDLVLQPLNMTQVMKDLFFYTFFSQGVASIWFIGLLIALYLTFPIMYALVGKSRRASGINLLIIIAAVNLLMFVLDRRMPEFASNINIAMTRVPIFAIGTYMGRYIQRGLRIKWPSAVIFIAATMLFGIYSHGHMTDESTIRFCTMIYSLGLLMLVVWILHGIENLKKLNAFFRLVGSYSLELYLTHVTLRNLMKTMGYPMYRMHVFGGMLLGAVVLSLILKPLTDLFTKIGAVRIGKGFLNLIYCFHKLTPVKNQITLISRQSDEPSLDIQMAAAELKKESLETTVRVLCRKIPDGAAGKLGYVFYIMGPMMHAIAQSRLIALDGYCIPASILHHRKSLTIVQMWHAMGAFKKFGYAVLGEKEGYSPQLAKVMNMHKGYDYIFVSSEECKEPLQEAYRCHTDQMVVMPLPRVDFLRREEYVKPTRERILRRYPFLASRDKKNILYAPTFRKNAPGLNTAYIQRLIEKTDFTSYNLIIKPHPLMKEKIHSEDALIDTEFSSMEMLSVADYVITDYSAFVLEAAVADKPVFRYVPDRKSYQNRRGFFVDLDQAAPGFASEDAGEVMEAIRENRCHLSEVRKFAQKFVEPRENCTEAIAQFLLSHMDKTSRAR
ncbi:MAG: CDP-glycerol glycerophosphotransferase family protein [Eubacterium sp.]